MLKTIAAALLVLAFAEAYGQSSTYQNASQIVPTTATNIFTASPAGFLRTRMVALDTAIAAKNAYVTTIWCAWGTAQNNPAVIDTNGFPLQPGFDDQDPKGYLVNQGALNCIQADGGGRYARFETYGG